MTAAGQFPRPGQLTYPDNIPHDMQTRFPWCMYKLVRKGAKFKKVPVSWRTDYSEIDPDDPVAQGTFHEVVAAMRSNPDGWYGIGIVLTPQTQALCFDADTPDAFGLLDMMNDHARTYVETSVSGVGRHYLWHGALPHGRAAVIDKSRGIEVYAHNRFIAITGNVLPQGNGHIADGSDMFAQMFASLPPPAEDVSLGVTDALGRSIGLSDRRVVGILAYRCRWAFDLLNSNANLADRSEMLMRIVGDLDKVTGDPQQIWRIMSKSPMIAQNGYNAEKFNRRNLFDSWIADARDGRGSNTQAVPNVTYADDGEGPSVEHGRMMFDTWKLQIVGELKNPDALLPMQALGGVSRKGRAAPVAGEDYREDTAHPASLTRAMVFQDIGRACDYFNQFFYVVTRGEPTVHSKYDDGVYKEHNFLKAYKHIRCIVKAATKNGGEELVETPAAPLWLNSPGVERYLRIDYEPVGVNEPHKDYAGQGIRNMWQGFGCKRLEREIADLPGECPTLWEYLHSVVAGGRSEVSQYLLKWLADSIQKPRRTGQRTAIMLYSSAEGSGKTTFGDIAGSLFHRDHTAIIRFQDIDGTFTERLENRAVLVCNEFFVPTANMRQQDAASVDKFRARIFDLIDHGRMTSEHKFASATEVNNYARVILSSNKSVLLPVGSRARRMFFVEVTERRVGHLDFWVKLREVIERQDGDGGELDRFFTYLADLDIEGFLPQGHKPRTAEELLQIEQAMPGIIKVVHDLLNRGELWWANHGREDSSGVVRQYFMSSRAVRQAMEFIAGHKIGMTDASFGRDIMNKLAVPGSSAKVYTPVGGVSVSGRYWPELKEARELFVKNFMGGSEVEWTNDAERWQLFQHESAKQ